MQPRRVAHYQGAINERAVTIDHDGCTPPRSEHNLVQNVQAGDIQRSQTIGDHIARLDSLPRSKTVARVSGQ